MNGDLSQSLNIVKNVECRHLIFSLETDNEQDTQIRFDVLIRTTLKGRPWDRRQQLWLPQKMQAGKFSLDFLTKLQNAIKPSFTVPKGKTIKPFRPNFYNVQSCSRQRGEEGGTELQNGSTLPTRELDLCQSRPLRSQTKFEPSLGSNTDTKTRGKDEGDIIVTAHASCMPHAFKKSIIVKPGLIPYFGFVQTIESESFKFCRGKHSNM